jgi:hypothetical protein
VECLRAEIIGRTGLRWFFGNEVLSHQEITPSLKRALIILATQGAECLPEIVERLAEFQDKDELSKEFLEKIRLAVMAHRRRVAAKELQSTPFHKGEIPQL